MVNAIIVLSLPQSVLHPVYFGGRTVTNLGELVNQEPCSDSCSENRGLAAKPYQQGHNSQHIHS